MGAKANLFVYAAAACLVTISLAVGMLDFVNSASGISGINISHGNNNLTFNTTMPFNVSSLVKLNPQIEVVSYYNGTNTLGYVNAFGGIGANFQIENGTMYEVFSSENTTLILPS